MKTPKTALALALAAALFACGSDDPASLLASAKQYMAKRDFNASVIQLKNVLQKSPENAEARYLLGLALLEQGDAVSAQIELDKAAAFGLASDELQVALARTALAKGESAKMLERFGAKTLATPKAQAELRALVGTAELARGRQKEAERAFNEALNVDPLNMTASLGTARLAAGRNVDEALSRVERALETQPAHLEAMLLRADLLAAQGRGEPAERAYRAATEAVPEQLAPRLALITHLVRHRAIDKASAEAAAMEKVAPRDPRTLYAKALVLVEHNKFPEAKEAILQVLKFAPEHVPSLTLAGIAALQTGALPEAESHLRKAVFKAPRALEPKRLLAATHLRMGKLDLALSEVSELLEVSEDPSIVALAGEVYLASGDVAKAASHYERAKALAPKNTTIKTQLAVVRLAAGDSERAVSELQAASAGDVSAYQADLALISNYLRKRDADNALKAVAALEKKQPDNPMTHNLRGGALLLKKDFAGARASFERALQIHPTYLPAVSNLAQLDLRDKKPQAAKQRYQAVLKVEPNNEQAILGLAVVLRVAGESSLEIEKLLVRAVAANPQSASARTSLIGFYLRNADAKAALAAANEAHAALPTHAGLMQILGTTQVIAGETRQAIGTFIRLSETMPKAPAPRLLLAKAHLVAKEPDEALKALRTALDLRPDVVVVQRDVAALYAATGRPEEALRHAREAQTESPKQPHGHVLEGEIRIAQKKFDLAERKYRETLKQFDQPAIAVRTHAAMEAAGKRTEAEAMSQDWLKRHPGDVILLSYLADRDLAAKRYESAVARYQIALKRQPDNAGFLNNLAWVASELKRSDALEYAERAHELAPQNPNIMDTLGVILVGSGQTERGLELLGRAAELAPDAHQIRLNFAKALLKAERKSAARKELEPLAKLDARLPVQQEAAKLLAGL